MTGAPVALDLDGTLLDCRPRQVALAASLAGPGFPAAAFWAAKRDGATTRTALERTGVAAERAAALAERWTAAIEDDAWLALDVPLPAARPALAELRRAGHEVVVVTARRRPDAARRQLDRLGLAGLVSAVEVVDPRRAAAEKGRCLRARGARRLVGDTESDASAAAAAGVAFSAVGCGQRSPAWLRAQGLAPIHRDVATAVAALLRCG